MSARTMYERPVEIRGFRYIRLKGGRLLSFWDAVTAAERAETDLTRAISRACKLAVSEYDRERVASRLDDLDSYVAAVRDHLAKEHGTQTMRERIELLRNVDGRTPEEAAAFMRKADELERRMLAGGER